MPHICSKNHIIKSYRILAIPWPSQSPDLNVIESTWRYMKNIMNKQECNNRIFEKEAELPPSELIAKYYSSTFIVSMLYVLVVAIQQNINNFRVKSVNERFHFSKLLQILLYFMLGFNLTNTFIKRFLREALSNLLVIERT